MSRLVALLLALLVLMPLAAAPPDVAPAPRPGKVHVAPPPHLPGEELPDLTIPDVGIDVSLPERIDPLKPGASPGPLDAVVGLPGLPQRPPIQLPFGFGPFDPNGSPAPGPFTGRKGATKKK